VPVKQDYLHSLCSKPSTDSLLVLADELLNPIESFFVEFFIFI